MVVHLPKEALFLSISVTPQRTFKVEVPENMIAEVSKITASYHYSDMELVEVIRSNEQIAVGFTLYDSKHWMSFFRDLETLGIDNFAHVLRAEMLIPGDTLNFYWAGTPDSAQRPTALAYWNDMTTS